MSSIFSNLDSLGLGGLGKMDIYEKEEEEKSEKQTSTKPKENDFIFDKSYTCPVCDKEFKSKTVKAGKLKLLEIDTDLRPRYQLMDPLKYDVIACPICGYAALNRYFASVTAVQAKLIMDNISIKFRGLQDAGEIWSYEDAVTRYQLALINAIVKKAKASEKAYVCLKTAWMFRGRAESLAEDAAGRDKLLSELSVSEADCIEKAYVGFVEAFSKEMFPMCGMDESTITYLVADLARKTNRNEEALRNLSRVIVARDANDRIKEKARDLKEIIMKKR